MAYSLILLFYVIPSVSVAVTVNLLASILYLGLPRWARRTALVIALLNIAAFLYLIVV